MVQGDLKLKLKELIFDSIVNHGSDKIIKTIQKYTNIKEDGIIGDVTLNAINNTEYKDQLYYFIIKTRYNLYANLASKNPDKYLTYLRGWINRINEFLMY